LVKICFISSCFLPDVDVGASNVDVVDPFLKSDVNHSTVRSDKDHVFPNALSQFFINKPTGLLEKNTEFDV
jgi:hypothetical protein